MKKIVFVIALIALCLAPAMAFELREVGIEGRVGMWGYGVVAEVKAGLSENSIIFAKAGSTVWPQVCFVAGAGYEYMFLDKGGFSLAGGAKVGIATEFDRNLALLPGLLVDASYAFEIGGVRLAVNLMAGADLGLTFGDDGFSRHIIAPNVTAGIAYRF